MVTQTAGMAQMNNTAVSVMFTMRFHPIFALHWVLQGLFKMHLQVIDKNNTNGVKHIQQTQLLCSNGLLPTFV